MLLRSGARRLFATAASPTNACNKERSVLVRPATVPAAVRRRCRQGCAKARGFTKREHVSRMQCPAMLRRTSDAHRGRRGAATWPSGNAIETWQPRRPWTVLKAGRPPRRVTYQACAGASLQERRRHCGPARPGPTHALEHGQTALAARPGPAKLERLLGRQPVGLEERNDSYTRNCTLCIEPRWFGGRRSKLPSME